jgi:exo-beta-1,3-glucanase (GH17 family)
MNGKKTESAYGPNRPIRLRRQTATAPVPVIGFIIAMAIVMHRPIDMIRAQEVTSVDKKSLHGICYSPFRDGDDPNWGIFPNLYEIEEDLSLLSGLTTRIRTYGNDHVLFEIPGRCYEEGINIYVGAWISWDQKANNQNIFRLIQIDEQGYPTTAGLIVGSEVLLRGDASEAELLDYLVTVKAATGIPVSTAETYGNYLSHEAIAEAVDFIFVHIHPYWDGISIEFAAQYVIDWYFQVQEAYPGKEVIIGETGWPTDGETVGEAVPGEANQKRFLDEFTRLAGDNHMKYFIFEAFDESWKIDEGTAGGSWGLYYSNRTPKPALDEYLEDNDTGNGGSTQSKGGGGGGGCFITSAAYGRNLYK